MLCDSKGADCYGKHITYYASSTKCPVHGMINNNTENQYVSEELNVLSVIMRQGVIMLIIHIHVIYCHVMMMVAQNLRL